MSEPVHHATPQHEHGTVASYVVGFILSVIFTLIPYYLVVNQTIAGNALLAAILGFAFVQMIIQITFFLHIGRGPKPRWNLFFFVSTGIIILFVVVGSMVIIDNLHYNMTPSDQTKKLINDEGIYQINGELTGACQVSGANHQVVIKNGQVTPAHTSANKCDTLTFITEDSARDITFGGYPQHLTYAGETTLSIQKEHNQTITLSDPGSYQFYDQNQPAAVGDFTVSQ